MTVKTECVHCRTRYTLKDPALVGKKIRCKKCGKPFKVERIDSVDEFDEEIEDYGDDEFGSPGDWPPAQSPPVAGTAAKSKQKKRKKKSGTAGAWKVPAIIGVVVVACGLGIWGLIQILPANLGSVFDSHEAIVDDSIQIAYDLVNAMEDLDSQADIPAFEKRIAELAEEAERFEERLLALGTISKDRMKEIQDYTRERRKSVGEDLRDRGKAVQEKVKNLNLQLNDQLRLLDLTMSMRLDWDLVLELPEPGPKDVYTRDLVALHRESFPILLKVEDSSNPGTYLGDLQDLTAKFEALSQRSDRAHPHVSSPYFRIRLTHSTYMSKIHVRVMNNESITEEVRSVMMNLGSASSVADSPF
jgi:predicted Zn finger-like uncharacterized protein